MPRAPKVQLIVGEGGPERVWRDIAGLILFANYQNDYPNATEEHRQKVRKDLRDLQKYCGLTRVIPDPRPLPRNLDVAIRNLEQLVNAKGSPKVHLKICPTCTHGNKRDHFFLTPHAARKFCNDGCKAAWRELKTDGHV